MSDRNIPALLAWLQSRVHMPHAWGRRENDCVSHAAGCVQAMTGEDRLGDLDWSTKAEAARLLADLGGLEAAMDARYRRIAPALARRGDIAGIADAEFGLSLAIVEGDTLVGPGDKRQRRRPRAAMIAAWSATDG